MPTLQNIKFMLSMPNLPKPHREILMEYLEKIKIWLCNIMRTEEQKNRDLQMGAEAEERMLPKLCDYFGETMYKEAWINALIDFYNYDKTIYVELKSRRIKFGDYPDMMIGKNKLDYFKAINKEGNKKFYVVISAYNGDFITEVDCGCDYRVYEKNMFIPSGDFVKF